MGKANRNRTAGHTWEREIATILNTFDKIIPEVGTARELSTFFDANKVDIVTKAITHMDDLGLAIQAKTTTTNVSYGKLLVELRENIKNILKIIAIPVIFHKQTKRINTRFMPRDKFAILFMDDFISIFVDMARYKAGFDLLNSYFDSISDEEKPAVDNKLKELGL